MSKVERAYLRQESGATTLDQRTRHVAFATEPQAREGY